MTKSISLIQSKSILKSIFLLCFLGFSIYANAQCPVIVPVATTMNNVTWTNWVGGVTNAYTANSINISGNSGGWNSIYSTQTYSLPLSLSFTAPLADGAMLGFQPTNAAQQPSTFMSNGYGFYVAGAYGSNAYLLDGVTGTYPSFNPQPTGTTANFQITISAAGLVSYYINGVQWGPTNITTNATSFTLAQSYAAAPSSFSNIVFTSYPPAPTLTSSKDTLTCAAQTVNLASTVKSSAIPPGRRVVWSLHNPPNNVADTLTAAQVAAMGTAGTYYATYDSASCIMSPATSAVVTTNGGAPVGATQLTAANCTSGGGRIKITGLPVGSTLIMAPVGGTSYNLQDSSANTTDTVNNLSAGKYYISYKVPGCSIPSLLDSITITTQPLPATPTLAQITPANCSGGGGSVAISGLTAGSPTWTINQTGTASASLPDNYNLTKDTATNLSLGTYNYTVTNNATGCTSLPASITFAPPTLAPPSHTITTAPTCTNDTATVTISGLPVGWTEVTESGSANAVFTGSGSSISGIKLTPGKYYFTYNNANQCTSQLDSIIVVKTVVPAPTIVSVTQPTCTNSVAQVTLGNIYNTSNQLYSQTNGSWSSNYVITPIGTSTYTVNVPTVPSVDSFRLYNTVTGCYSAYSPKVTINAQPVTPVKPTLSQVSATCIAGGKVILTGLTPATGWTINQTGVSSGTYTGTATKDTISNLAPGKYYFSLTNNATGCTTVTDSIVVTTVAAPAILNPQITQPTCALSTGTVSNYWTPNESWTIHQTGTTTANYSGTTQVNYPTSGLAPGKYYFTVTDNVTGCTSPMDSATINQAVPNTPVIGTVVQPNCNSATGSVTLTGLTTNTQAGTNEYIYTYGSPAGWATTTTPNSTFTVTGLTAGIVDSFRAYNSTTGCYSAYSSKVTMGAAPAVPIVTNTSVVQPTCATSTGSAIIKVNAAHGWKLVETGAATSTASGASGASVTAATLTNLAAGSYYFAVTDTVSGCTTLDTLVINQATPNKPIIASVVQPSCSSSTGSVTLSGLTTNAQAGTNEYIYTYGSPAGWATTTTPNSTFTVTGLTGGIVDSFRAYNSTTGCYSAYSSKVSINAAPQVPPTLSGAVTQPTCTTPTATGSFNAYWITSTGPWTINQTGTSSATYTGAAGTNLQKNITGLATGKYYFTVTNNASGCTSGLDSISITQTMPNTPNVTVIQPTCSNPKGSVTVSGLTTNANGSTYYLYSPVKSWIETSIPTSTYNLTNLSAGYTDSFRVYNASQGCWGAYSKPVKINAQPLPSSSTVNDTICAGTTFTWHGTTYSATASPAGVYHTTNKAGCDSTVTLNLYVKPVATISQELLVQPTCSNPFGSVYIYYTPSSNWTLTQTGTYNATYSGVQNNANFPVSNLEPGTYNFTFKDQQGCPSTSTSVTIVPFVSKPATGSITQPTCTVGTGTVNLAGLPTSGTGAWTLYQTGKAAQTYTNSIANTSTKTVTGLAPGTYYYQVKNSTGCLSTYDTVVIKPQPLPTTSIEYDTICAGTSFTWHGSTYSVTGNNVFHTTNAAGCDSAVTLALYVRPAVTPPSLVTSTQPTCASPGSVTLSGLPTPGNWTINQTGTATSTYTGSGSSKTVAIIADGTLNFSVTNSFGCTSAGTSSITINPSPQPAPKIGTVVQPNCATATGSVTLNGLPSAGTWKLVTYNNGDVAIDSINGTGTSKTLSGLTPGTYVFTVDSAINVCLSAASASITINPQPVQKTPIIDSTIQPTCATATGGVIIDSLPSTGTWTINQTGTASKTYSGTGNPKTISGLAPGTYYFSSTNANGCTSLNQDTIVINAQPIQTAPSIVNVSQPTCVNPVGTIELGNLPDPPYTITQTGTVSQTITNATASDTIIENLAPGTYQYTVTNAAGCTSTITATDTIYQGTPLPPSVGTITQASCGNPNGGVTFHGLPTTPGGWIINQIDNLGNITNYTGVATDTTISGLTAGSYAISVSNLQGCVSSEIDSVYILPVSSIKDTIYQTICVSSLPYTWNDSIFAVGSTGGVFNFDTTNASGCDSLTTLFLTIKATSTSTTNTSICPSALPYLWNGINRASAGTYTFTTTNAVGCDSVATLNLTVKATSTSTSNTAICPSALPYMWNGINRAAAGTYTFTTTNSVGCDSVATLNLTVKATSTSTTNTAICPSALPYMWNGINRAAAGTYTFTTTNSVGCDSVVTLNLTVKATSTSTTNTAICPSALPYLWNGINRVAAGTYTFTTTNAVGCDSVATLNLTVKATSTSTTNTSICPSALPYMWNGINRTTAGTYTFTTTNSVGCDSVATLNLTVKATSTSTTNTAICPSALPYMWNGINRASAGTYTYTTTNSVGCDSVATLNLTVKATSTSTTNTAICPSALPYMWNGINRATAGTYTYTTTNSVGCDSVATLNLTVKTTSTSTTNITICQSALPYLWNGINRGGAGTFTYTTTNAVGCDSVATLNLTVKPTSTSVTNTTICQSALPYTWNGVSRAAAGTYTYTTTNSVGCDSIATLILSVNPSPIVTPITASGTTTFCNNSSVNLTAPSAPTGQTYTYQWQKNGVNIGAATANPYTAISTGSYQVVVTSNNGCTAASAATAVTVNTPAPASITLSTTFAAAPSCGNAALLTASPAGLSYKWFKNGSTTPISTANPYTPALPVSPSALDAYVVEVTDANGCKITSSNIVIDPAPTVSTNGALTVCAPTTVDLSAVAGVNQTTGYQWTLNGANISGATSLNYSATQSGTYTFKSTNADNSQPRETCPITVTVHPVPSPTITVNPNPICAGDSATLSTSMVGTYAWKQDGSYIPGATGQTYTHAKIAGNYSLYYTDAFGCIAESPATALVIKAKSYYTENVIKCSNQLPYLWNGTNHSTSGTYTYTAVNAAGCDSVVTLNLTIKDTTTSTTDVTICPSSLPYTWNGTNITTQGIYTYKTTNAAGCDSIATLNLLVKAVSTSTTNVSVCPSGLPYLWNSISRTAAGTYTYSTTNSVGCDSVATLVFTVKDTTTSTTTITKCSNQIPYTWNGTAYSTTGNYQKLFTNAAGCDSVAKLIFTVTDTTTSTTTVTKCSNQIPYTWNGTNYSTSGNYQKLFTNAAGCDSVAKLIFTVTDTTTSTTTVTKCSNQIPYTWNGTNYSTSGNYQKLFTNAAGCDSVAKLIFTVTDTTTSTTNITKCSNQIPYTWNGTSYSTSGNYQKLFTNAAGCDSVAKLIFVVTDTTTSTTTVTKCSNQIPYTWNGTAYSTTGNYQKLFTNAAGCDSVAKLVFIVKDTTTSTTTITKCSNQIPYTWNGTTYSTTGNYQKLFTNAAGCDSVAKLVFTVTDTTTSTTNITKCSNQIPYTWNGTNYSTSGNYQKLFTNAAGCDSIAKLIFVVKDTTTSTTTVTKCSNQIPYTWNGTAYSTTGNYQKLFTNAAGCDSVAKLIFVVKDTTTSTTTVTKCSNQIPYTWNGTNYSTSGNYQKLFTNAAGCDSVAKLIFVVKDTTTSTTTVTKCSNQIPYTWNGTNYSTSGNYQKLFTNAAGCDSVAKLIFTVTDTTTSTTNITKCSNQIPYTWNGTNYSTSGNYQKLFTNAAGCDSIAKLIFVVKDTTTSTTTVTKCSNQIPYTWNGTAYSTTGNYQKLFTNAAGCDSVAKLVFTVTDTTTSTTNITKCSNQIPYTWNGTSYSTSGNYQKLFTNAAGCDSIAKLIFVVKDTTTSTTTVTKCSNQIPYTWNGTAYSTTGNYQKLFTNAAGCDSVAKLVFTVTDTTTSTTNITKCSNQIPYTWNGTSYSTSGNYQKLFTNAAGCDSIAKLIFVVKDTTTSTTTVTKCSNQIPYTWNGTAYSTTGNYQKLFTNAAGCDSVAKLIFVVKDTTTSTTTVTKCSNQIPYTWNGTAYSTTGNYQKLFTNAAGCDSVAKLIFTVTDTTTSTTTVTKCSNQIPYTWNGTAYSTTGNYQKLFTNAAGCDSIAKLIFVVKDTTTSTTTVTKCSNQIPYTWNGTAYSTTGNYQKLFTNAAGCDSVAKLIFVVKDTTTSTTTVTKCSNQIPYTWNGTAYSTTGNYQKLFTNAAGCDSVAKLVFTVTDTTTSTTNITKCSNQIPYTWNGTSYSTSGNYQKLFTNAAGCDSIAKLIFVVKDTTTSTTTVTKCSNQIPYTWNGTAYSTTGNYQKLFTNAAGCDSVAKLVFTVTDTTTSTTNITKCSNQIPYTWNGTSYSTSGNYQKLFTNAAGCDSIAKLIFVVKDTTTSTTTVTKCSNQIPYTWNGTAYSTTGNYQKLFTNAAGCDSVAKLIFVVKDTTTSTTTVTKCSNQIPYTWNGTNYSTSGNYQKLFTNAAGCDSVAKLIFTVTDTTTSTTNITKCSNQIPYTWNGTNYSTSGNYQKLFTNAAGCDSVAKLIFVVKDTTTSTTTVTKCSNQIPYTWNGTAYSTTGNYQKLFTNAAGCDSVAKLIFVVKDTTTSTTTVTKCSNQIPYTWNGTAYSTTGNYQKLFTNAAGCDSVAKLVFTVTDTTTSTTNITKCSNQIPYTWNGTSYSTSGNYQKLFTNAAGCDSIAKLIFVVKDTTTSTTTVTKCSNQIPYTWNGTAYSTTGNYQKLFTNAAGCDSVAKLIFVVKDTTTSTTTVTKCSNQIPYTWNGTAYSTTGNYQKLFTNAAGCDSVAKLIFVVKDTTTSTTTVTKCSNQIPYTWNGTNYSTSGNYQKLFTNAAGCDSVAKLIFTVTDTTTSTTTVTKCSNQIPYTWNGTNYSTSGNYQKLFTNAAGCDSVAKLIFTVTDTTTSTTTVTKCSNQIPYTWNGTNYSTSGNYQKLFTNAAGCDSVAKLIFTVTDTTTSTTTVTKCSNQIPYTWNGTSYSTSGNYQKLFTNAAGCDSIAKLIFVVKDTTTSTTTVTKCSNQIPYTWNGTAYSTTGNYQKLFTNAAGCDSVAKLVFTVTDTTTSTTNITKCSNQIPYTWNGTSYSTSGNYQKLFTNAAGCDSIAKLIFVVKDTTTSTTTVTKCSNQIPYTWNGTAYSTTGNYQKLFTNAAGCDSVAKLIFVVKDTTTSTTTVTKCSNQIPYTWNGTAYSTTGNYQKLFTNAAGCDSVAKLIFTVTDTTTSTTTVTKCSNQIPYTWNGTAYSTTGNYQKLFTNAAGCDSIAKLIFVVKDTTTSTTTVTKCSNQIPYTWNGTAYSTTGNYQKLFTNAAGCDSVAKLIFVVKDTTTSTTTVTKCSNQIPYTWNGTAYSTTGNYQKLFTNAAGCDSVAKLVFTVTDTTTSTTNITKCSNQIPYTWNGTSYSTSGNYQKLFTNAAGCDSIAKLIFVVKDTTTSTTTVTKCSNQIPYTWNGTAYSTTGNYQKLFTNAAGCDSVAKLVFTVTDTTTSTTNITKCSNQIPYTWNGTSYSTSGNYQKLFTNAAGCDSIAKLIFVVKDTTTSTTTVTKCSNQIPYTWNGTAYSTTGNYQKLFTNAAGCDSVAKLIFVVKDTTTSTTTVTKCSNQIPYTWNGTNYSTSGNYQKLFTNAAGCDSVAKLIFTVTDTTTSTTNITKCSNQIPYTWNGTNYSTSGNYQKLFTNAAGCDSVAKLIFVVKDTTTSTTTVTKCSNQIPYTWNGTAYSTTGNYQKLFTNAAGCDSVAKLIFVVKDTTTSTTTVTKCSNQIPYTWNGTAYSTTGNYQKLFTNAAGCDSVAKLVFTVTDTTTSTTNITKCSNQIPYTWNGTSYSTSGNYQKLFTNAAGCDSIAKLIFVVKDTTTSTTTVTKCSNQIPYTWNGTAYSTTGNYQKLFTNAAGCDSVAKLIFVVKDTTTSTTTVTKCSNQIPYTWNGTAYSTTGNYQKLFTNAAGCDSVAKLIFVVKDTTTSTTTVTKCSNQIPYTWNGTNYSTSGNYQKLFTNAAGCDSVAKLIFTVTDTTTSTTTVTKCSNQIPYTWNGTNYSTSGNYQKLFTNAAGCDSVAKLIFTVTDTTTSTTTVTKCSNQIPYTWNGTNYSTSGNYQKLFTNAAGCDSVAKLIFTVTDTTTSTTTVTKCSNQIPYTWNGTSYSTSGNYQKLFTNAAGCDSVAKLIFVVKDTTTSTTTVTKCSNQIPYTWNGTAYSTTGNYQKLFTNAAGCDSVAKLIFTVTDTTTSTTTVTKCSNQIPYTWNGTAYSTTGNYQKLFTNAAGCDSVAKLIFVVKDTTTSTTTVTKCSNQIPYTWNGTAYSTTGNYQKLFTNAAGCDSVAKLIFTVTDTTTSTTTVTKCSNQIPYTWNGTAYSTTGNYQKLFTNAAGCDSVAKLVFTVTDTTTSTTNITKCSNQIPYTWNGTSYSTSGNYQKLFTNAAGCDSIAKLIFVVKDTTTSTTTVTKCSNQIPYTWNGTAYSTTGNYQKLFTNAAGCDSVAKLVFTVTDTTTSTTNITKCSNQIPYTWNGTSYSTSGNYQKLFTNAAGCDSIAKLIFVVKDTTTSTTTVTKCSNQIPYTWNGTAYSTTGNYQKLFTNAAGCDSVAKLVFTVTDTTTSTTNITKCSNQIPYTWNGTSYSTSGNYQKLFTNAAGCDSIAKLIFVVKDTTTSTTSVSYCNTLLPYVWNGISINSAGQYLYSTVNAAGCDSIAKLDFSINNCATPDTIVTPPAACPTCAVGPICAIGDDIPLGAGTVTYSSCGSPSGYTQIVNPTTGCVTYTPTSSVSLTDTEKSCIVICKNGVCDTTYIFIPPPISPDTIVATPVCPTCPVIICVVGNDIGNHAGATYSTCGTPQGYTVMGPDINGCYSYKPKSVTPIDTESTCIVICNNGLCDTTQVIIYPPNPIENPDVNIANINAVIHANVNTNDVVPSGTTYGLPIENSSNLPGATITMNADGTYTFNAPSAGVYIYEVPVCAPGQTMPCPTTKLTITVLDNSKTTNNPVANTDLATTKTTTPVTLHSLTNDLSGNVGHGGTLVPSSVVVVTPPAHGSITVNSINGDITYQANAGFIGKDTLYYSVTDSNGNTSIAMQVITILPQDAGNTTTATDDYASGLNNGIISGNIKTNDIDPEGNTTHITPIDSIIVGKGHLVVDSFGNYTFTPLASYSGSFDMPYVITDNLGATAKATIYIIINNYVNPLPIVWDSFNLLNINCYANLSWQVENVKNVNYFEIQKSNNAVLWSKVGEISTIDKNNPNTVFTFKDNTIISNQSNFYRVKEVDVDSKEFYSPIKSITCSDNSYSVYIYPNPTENDFTIELNRDATSEPVFYVYDAIGQRVQLNPISKINNRIFNFTLSHLASDVYTICVDDGIYGRTVLKVVKR